MKNKKVIKNIVDLGVHMQTPVIS